MSALQVEFTDGGLPRAFVALDSEVSSGLAQAVYLTGASYQTRVRARASLPKTGPPGPRAITGDYRRSITLTNTFDGGQPVALVHTNRPQARRLEFGFVGPDILGRVYNQPPYPHWRPAAEGMDRVLQQHVRAVINGAIRKGRTGQ